MPAQLPRTLERMDRLTVSLDARLEEIDRLMAEIDAFARPRAIPAIALQRLDLVIDEVLTNTIRYGDLDPGAGGGIDVSLSLEGQRLALSVEDDGKAFDPLSLHGPRLDLPLEERSIGGLGIYLVRSLTDEVAYERRAGRNRFTAVIDLARLGEGGGRTTG